MRCPSKMPLLLSCLMAMPALAQTTETPTTTVTRKTTEIRNGDIVYVNGNQVVVSEPSGVREYTVPQDFKFQLDGKSVGVADLRPGMKVSAVITDTTTTQVVTVTREVSGKVLVVGLDGVLIQNAKTGKMTEYKSKDVSGRDITILRDGKPIKLTDLKVGERLNATIITTLPPQVVTQREVKARLTHPTPAVAAPAPAPAPASQPVAMAELPRTASPLPLIGLLGAAFLAIATGLRGIRNRR